MGQAFYRKYRSKKLDEVIGQDHITQTLKNALKTGKISHAYLFTGPKGVGKTSAARIFAHEVNNFPYEDDKYYVDIIEIDAASNRRIDEIRDLRDKVHVAPTLGKYKVYIIDEVHMLTKEAFNALLKTLEEPPAHVIFILATTEAHKLPATIVSRTQRFTFKPIEETKVIEHLRSIAKSEGLKVDEEALNLIAKHGEGSFRDSISLLDQAGSMDKQISLGEVQELLGLAPDEVINNLVAILATGTSKDLLDYLDRQYEHGISATGLAKQLATGLRIGLLNNTYVLSANATTTLLKELISVPASPDPARLLELHLLSIVLGRKETLNSEPLAQPKAKPVEPIQQIVEKAEKAVKKQVNPDSSQFDTEIWPKVLDTIKSQHNTLYSIMRMARPSYDGQTLTLEFEFGFHQKRINEVKNRKIIDTILNQYLAQPVELIPIVGNSSSDNQIKNDKSSQAVKAISNIFGGAEVLDS